MSVRKLLQRPVPTLPPDATAHQAAGLMEHEGVGAVVVVLEGRPLGIVTDRDLTVRVMARRLDARQVRLHEVMNGTPIYLSENRHLDEFIGYMREMAVREIMVVDDDRQLIGMLTLDDLLLLLIDQLGALATVVRPAVTGQPPPRPEPLPESDDEDM